MKEERGLHVEETLSSFESPLADMPSGQVVYRLASRSFTPYEQLSQLSGKRVKLMGPSLESGEKQIIGVVNSVVGRELKLKPEACHLFTDEGEEYRLPINAREISVNAYLATQDPYESGYVDYEDPSIEYGIYCRPPHRVDIVDKNQLFDLKAAFNYVDPYLDRLLIEALDAFPNVSDIQNLTKLTSWLHNRIQYGKSKQVDYARFRLGAEIANNESVCRHISALELGILELNGIASTPIVSYDGTKGHMYLGVDAIIDGAKERVVVDPTWNLVGRYSFIRDELSSRGELAEFHLPENAIELDIIPNWEYKDYQSIVS